MLGLRESRNAPMGCFTVPRIHKPVFILFYNFIELILLVYIFLVISFDRYKEYMI